MNTPVTVDNRAYAELKQHLAIIDAVIDMWCAAGEKWEREASAENGRALNAAVADYHEATDKLYHLARALVETAR